jgi:hypothetical protein
MLPTPDPLPRVVHADGESPRARIARAFAADCAAAALEVFERQRCRDPRPCASLIAARRARAEGCTMVASMFLRVLVASPPSER